MRVLNLHTHVAATSVEHSITNAIAPACNIHLDLDLSRLGIRHDMHTPMLHMDRVRHGKPYMAIDATSRIPTGVRLVAVVHTNGNDIVATAQITGDVIFERAISIRTSPQLLTIDVNRSVHIDTIELDKIHRRLIHPEMLTIPAHTTRQCPPAGP